MHNINGASTPPTPNPVDTWAMIRNISLRKPAHQRRGKVKSLITSAATLLKSGGTNLFNS
jgi:hypothetical protein